MFKVLGERTVTDEAGVTQAVPTIRAYSRDDPGLSEADVDRIASGARRLVLVYLSSGELDSFVQCNEAGAYYRVSSDFWAWWAAHNATNCDPLPVTYQVSPFHTPGDDKFLGAKLMIAKVDGDAVVGCAIARPQVTTSLAYTVASVANENAANPCATGFAGRPAKSRQRIMLLFKERNAGGKVDFEKGLAHEVREILKEFAEDPANAGLEVPASGTTENALRSLFNRLKGGTEWPKIYPI